MIPVRPNNRILGFFFFHHFGITHFISFVVIICKTHTVHKYICIGFSLHILNLLFCRIFQLFNVVFFLIFNSNTFLYMLRFPCNIINPYTNTSLIQHMHIMWVCIFRVYVRWKCCKCLDAVLNAHCLDIFRANFLNWCNWTTTSTSIAA